jgi:uncharacterized protein YndB with AHSA1/START domain
MIINKETVYTVDASKKKLKVVRDFDAPVDLVWRAWTEAKLLDQWWAPKPWKANTTSMDFREGGQWLYYMQGPEGERHYCKFDYSSIKPQKSIAGQDAFCDEAGNTNLEFPRMDWYLMFNSEDDGTRVETHITFASEADLNKIVEMGFKEGFAMAHNNLDELLANS